jgi:hypothetical protein
VKSEFAKAWKEMTMTKFEELSQYLPGGADKNQQKTSIRIGDLNWNIN